LPEWVRSEKVGAGTDACTEGKKGGGGQKEYKGWGSSVNAGFWGKKIPVIGGAGFAAVGETQG